MFSCGFFGVVDKSLVQVVLLSLSFMFIFTADMTMEQIAQVVLESAGKEDASFSGDGYVSLAINYVLFALFTWFAPSIVTYIGVKKGLVLASVFYPVYITGLIVPHAVVIYSLSALLGAAAAVLWTAQGSFIASTSTPQTISRNSAIFWSLQHCSSFTGNIFVYYTFDGKEVIDSDTRVLVMSVLAGIGVLGVVGLCFLQNDNKKKDVDNNVESAKAAEDEAEEKMGSFKEIFYLARTQNMLLLSCLCLYTGVFLTFHSGIYSTAVGFTESFGPKAKALVGLVGVFFGVGGVTGGILLSVLGSLECTKNIGKSTIAAWGLIINLIGFGLIYLNLPTESPLMPTKDVSYFNPPSPYLALGCAVLLGFGDACIETQLWVIFGLLYEDKSLTAFALLWFTRSITSSASFYLSCYLGINWHLLILSTTCIVGCCAFFIVDYKTRRILRAPRPSVVSLKGRISHQARRKSIMPGSIASFASNN